MLCVAGDPSRRRHAVFIFCIRGTRPDLPHVPVTQSNPVYKAKLTFFSLYCVPVSCSLHTFPVMPGVSFYQNKPRDHSRESKLLFPIRDSFFRGNKSLKK